MAKEIAILFLALISIAHSTSIADDLVLNLPNGSIQGSTYLNGNNRTYYGFRGIPYATPPLGDLRFESPQPAEPWGGVWNATTDSKACVTSEHFTRLGLESEDCLYVNVYVPTLKPQQKLPVMFWIFGGAFIRGYSDKSKFGPDFLIEKDVIIVTFNYRVGPFGFISTGDKVLPGNMGLKDQNLALKWTRQNIEYFGGDPEKITIFGQSSGGTSVGLHLVSKQSAGLFRAAIVESGSALEHWAVDWDPKTTAYLIADGIRGGNYGNDTQKLKEFLKTQTVENIMISTLLVPAPTQVWPTIEPESDDAFVTESHYERLNSGNFNQVPIVIGIAAEEGLAFLGNLENAKLQASLHDLNPTSGIPPDVRPNTTDVAEVATKIRDIYLKKNETFLSNLLAYADYFSDFLFARGVIKHAEVASKYVPVYLYQFAYSGSSSPAFIDGAEKATHAAELRFMFNMTGRPDDNTISDDDLLTRNRLVSLWTNFAKYLNPTPEESELFSNITWPITSPENLQYLNFNKTLEIRQSIKNDTFGKWNEIYETYGAKPFITF